MMKVLVSLIGFCIALAEVPNFPHQAQWKIPLFHKREKPSFHKVTFVPLPQPIKTHKETEEFVKTLEYNAQNELQNSADLGLVILDLNSVMDENIAEQVAEGVEVAIAKIDQETGETAVAKIIEQPSVPVIPTLRMHQGKYELSSELNVLIDGLLKQTQKVMKRREMDPLFFTVHKRGIVRHKPGDAVLSSGQLAPGVATANDTEANSPIGGGIITGLTKIKRFGNIEKRIEGNETLMRSNFHFGPLKIDLVFETKNGLRMVNSTLSSLAGHALFSSTREDDSLKVLEFFIDSPMDYEIRMKSSRNMRLRTLSEAAIIRLFKRSGRMEVRLERCFSRAALRSIPDLVKNVQKEAPIKPQKPNKKFMKLDAMRKTH